MSGSRGDRFCRCRPFLPLPLFMPSPLPLFLPLPLPLFLPLPLPLFLPLPLPLPLFLVFGF
jgi:hypothetical protein